MLIAHCADIHLDSALCGVKDAKLRRYELLESFQQMVKRINDIGVRALIISGDLFDSDTVYSSTINTVLNLFSQYDNIQFFVLRGNHGGTKAYQALQNANLKNVHFFKNGQWNYYKIDDVVISGCELDGVDDYTAWNNLNLPNNCYNILVLHGDIDDSKYGVVDLKTLAHSRANYIALGHRHQYNCIKLNNGAMAVYSGALESRGFDEGQSSGFVILNTTSHRVEFVQQAIRQVVTVEVDISGIDNQIALHTAVEQSTINVGNKNYLNLVLCGKRSGNYDLELLKQRLQSIFFAVRIEDSTTLNIDYNKLSQELSLRGKVVELAMKKFADIHQRNEVIRLALLALSGEDL